MEKYFINFSETNKNKIKNLLTELTNQKNIKKELITIANSIRTKTEKEYSSIFK